MFCRRCGSRIPQGLGMCSVCGLETSAPWPAAAPDQPVTQSPVVPPPRTEAAPARAGVGGWLLFFCICFTIVWPLWTLGQYALFHFTFRGLGWLGPLRLGLGFMVGVMLWGKSPGAMGLLRVYYGLGVLTTLWAVTVWIRFGANMGNPAVVMSFIRGFVIPVIFLVAGIVYFSQSERVRATYGTKLL